MGVGAADEQGRLAAIVGELDAVAPDFTPALDVPNGGLPCALPALLAVGLLEGVERHLQLPKGHYGLDSLLLLLAFMALARLEQRLPAQADREALEADALRHRFTLVFDREGYSPDFLRRMKARRIACLTYHKFPGEDWPQEELAPAQVRLPGGEAVTMDLAERGTCLRNGLWVRELRKRSERGHQTAILCTDYRSEPAPLAMAMFARWSHESFFKYARENFSLDRLVDYRTEVSSDPLQVVNPDDAQVRSATGKLTSCRDSDGQQSA